MINKYFRRKRNEDGGNKFFYEVLVPDLMLFAFIVAISIALLIFMFKTVG